MSQTPVKTDSVQMSHSAKRMLVDTSPEDVNSTESQKLVGNVQLSELMKMMQLSMEAVMENKLQNVATKSDIAEIKNHIADIDDKFKELKAENDAMRSEIAELKADKEKGQEQILRLVEQSKRKNLFVKGIMMKGSPKRSVEYFFKNTLKLADVKVISARAIYSSRNKINTIVEMQDEEMVRQVLKNTNKLAGTNIIIEKDLSERRQQNKKVLFQLKTEILGIDKTHKVFVRNDSIKIGTKWMSWSRTGELMCGKNKADAELKDLYGDKFSALDLSYNNLLSKINQKN